MTDILVDVFPSKVTANVLLFLSDRALTTLLRGLPEESELRPFVLSRMYKTLEVFRSEQLVEAANLDAPVETLYLRGDNDYVTFFKQNPGFVSRISDVHLWLDCFHDYEKYSKMEFRSIHLNLESAANLKLSEAPRNLKSIHIAYGGLNPIKMKAWLPSLTCFKVSCHANLRLIDLPEDLKELSCEDSYGFWGLLPSRLEKLELISMESLSSNLTFFPESLKELSIKHCTGFTIGKLLTRLPMTLKKLRLKHITRFSSNEILLPESLQELSIRNCSISNMESLTSRLPSSLKKLDLILTEPSFSNQILFPSALRELIIGCISDIEDTVARLPASLKKLTLELDIGSKLASLEFPDSLEVLNLSYCEIESLEGFKFPNCLVEFNLGWNNIKELKKSKFPESLTVLNLERNEITTIDSCAFPQSLMVLNLERNNFSSLNCEFPKLRELYASENSLIALDGATFPELEVLDISNYPSGEIRSMMNVKFPSSLKVLKAVGHCIRDYPQTRLPSGLEELEINVSEKAHRLLFPPKLKCLNLTLPNTANSEFSLLNLPATLIKLEITNGICTEFDWRLPHLEELNLNYFQGRLRVPPSVKTLFIHVEDAEQLKSIVVTNKLGYCRINSSSGTFNEAITDLIEFQRS